MVINVVMKPELFIFYLYSLKNVNTCALIPNSAKLPSFSISENIAPEKLKLILVLLRLLSSTPQSLKTQPTLNRLQPFCDSLIQINIQGLGNRVGWISKAGGLYNSDYDTIKVLVGSLVG